MKKLLMLVLLAVSLSACTLNLGEKTGSPLVQEALKLVSVTLVDGQVTVTPSDSAKAGVVRLTTPSGMVIATYDLAQGPQLGNPTLQEMVTQAHAKKFCLEVGLPPKDGQEQVFVKLYCN